MIMTKKNAAGGGSISRRKDGRWRGDITIGLDPLTGKTKRRTVYGKSQGEVRQKVAAIVATLDKGEYLEPSKLTVGQWLGIWRNEYLDGVKPNTKAAYKNICNNILIPVIGAIDLVSLSPHAVQTFINRLNREERKMTKYSKTAKAYSPKSVRNIHGVLHKSLQIAKKIGYLKTNPADKPILKRAKKADIQPLDEQEIAVFLQAIKNHRFERLFFVALFTGMRRGEILGLTWDKVDFDKGVITVDNQLQYDRAKKEHELVSTKNGKARTITPPERVMSILREQKRLQAGLRLAAGEVWQDNNFVFTNAIGGYIALTTLRNHFKKVVAAIGLPERRFHDLRHTYATTALANGVNVKDVQETLGHYSAAFTLDTYGHTTTQSKKESAAKIDALIGMFLK